MGQRTFLTSRPGFCLTAVLLVFCTASKGQTVDPTWSQPFRLSTPGAQASEGYLAADSKGRVHVIWTETAPGENRWTIQYARFDGERWSPSVEIYVSAPGFHIGRMATAVDQDNVLHLTWTESNDPFLIGPAPARGPVKHSSAPADQAVDPSMWQTPNYIQVPAFWISLTADSSNRLHLLYSVAFHTEKGVFHSRSTDGGKSWSAALRLDPQRPPLRTPYVTQLQADSIGGLHALWYYELDTPPGGGASVVYARSIDGGMSFQDPVVLDDSGEAMAATLLDNELRMPFPALAVAGQEVHPVWAAGGVINVGRRDRFSLDRGESFSDSAQLFGELHGQANGDGLAVDSDGRIHFIGQIRWPQGLYHAVWEEGRWSQPELIYLIAADAWDPIGDRIHAHSIRLAFAASDQMLATFTTSASPDSSTYSADSPILFAMNTRSGSLQFPHLGDGRGLSMRFLISNPTERSAAGRLRIHDSNGDPVELTFSDRQTSEIDLVLPPFSTEVLTTAGISDPVQSGYAVLESGDSQLTGVATFEFLTGSQASVAGGPANRNFALFVERSDTLDTGIAARRFSDRTIALSLYDLQGQLVGAQDWNPNGVHGARFISELFDLPAHFRGSLTMESEGDFAAVGLRFGKGLLSTIPAVDVDVPAEREGKAFYYPHYGDGEGLSMLFAAINLSNQPAAGQMTFHDRAGNLQSLPMENGAASQVPLDLPPRSTHVLSTVGDSQPVRSGYVRVEQEDSRLSGVAIFQVVGGSEASVLPADLGRRFAMVLERSADSGLDTGIAVVRTGDQPVRLRIFDREGQLLVDRDFPVAQRQDAVPLGELADMPSEFVGLAVLESEEDFTVLGLRFTRQVLSTVPVTPLAR